jgi:hypothetical protein
MPVTQKFLTPDDVVARWGGSIEKGTLANWRSQGKGPPFSKRGAKVVYPLDTLEAYEAANDNKPNNDKQP